jgi:hypothetical protein
MIELPEDYRELQQIAKDLGVPATGSVDDLKARILEHSAANPAVEGYQDLERPREYRVTGPHKVFGHEPGSTFRAVIPPNQEARLIARHQITPVDATADDNPTQED